MMDPLDDYRSTTQMFLDMKVEYEESVVKSRERRVSQLLSPDQRSAGIAGLPSQVRRLDPGLASVVDSHKYPTDSFLLHAMTAGAKAYAWLAFPDLRSVTATVPFLGYRHGYLQGVMLADEDPPVVAMDSVVVNLYSQTLARTIVTDDDADDCVEIKRDASIELLRFGWTRDSDYLASAMKLLDESGLAIWDESGPLESYRGSTSSEFYHFISTYFVLHEIGHVVQATSHDSGYGPLDETTECEEMADRFAMHCLVNVLIPRSTHAAMLSVRAVAELFLTLSIRDQLAPQSAISRHQARWDRRWERLHGDLSRVGAMGGLQDYLDESHQALLARAQVARATDIC